MIRLVILASSDSDDLLKGKVELDESYFEEKLKGKRDRGDFNKVAVFDILDRNVIVKVEVVKDVKAELYST